RKLLSSTLCGIFRTFGDVGPFGIPSRRESPGKRAVPGWMAALDHRDCGRARIPGNLTTPLVKLSGYLARFLRRYSARCMQSLRPPNGMVVGQESVGYFNSDGRRR